MARKPAPSKKKTNGIAVDFSDTETQATLPEGDYLLEVDEIEQKTSDNSGADYLSFTFVVAEGEYKGKKVWHNCSLQPQALFNLRGVLEALGYDVPQGVMELDPDDLIGEQCGASVVLETYEGKQKPRIAECFLASELGEDPPAKSTAKPAASSKKKAPPADEPDEPVKPAAKKKAVKKVEPDPDEFEVGDKVSFTDDEGDTLTGKITEIEGDDATVKVGKDEWEIPLEDLTKA